MIKINLSKSKITSNYLYNILSFTCRLYFRVAMCESTKIVRIQVLFCFTERHKNICWIIAQIHVAKNDMSDICHD